MDGCNSYFNTRHGRNGSQSTNNDRQLSESSNPSSFNHPRLPTACVSQSLYHNRQNSAPSEQRSTDLNVQFQKPANLHFDYHSRYPSPPTTQRSPNSPPSPPLNPTLHRANSSSSSSAGGISLITLPPLSSVAHLHRGVDQSPDHEISLLPTMQRKPPSITQLPRNHPEQGTLRRHTLDSGYVPDPQIVSGGRKRTLSTLPSPNLLGKNHPSAGTLHVLPPHPPPPPPSQPGQTKLTSRHYSSPPPPPIPRRDNPPPLTMSPSPILPSTSQPSQISSQSSQPAATDGSSTHITITSVDEAADVALEPLRLGFENIWTETVQNVRQVMSKMQKDLSRLNADERRKNVNLMRCLVSNSEKIKGHEWAVDELRKENSSLMEKALENEQLRRENNQKRTVMDTLTQENHKLRRENEELRKKNEEVKEALTRAAEFIFQYKEELAKVKADAETFRKCREASVLSANDQTVPAATDLPREITRLHAEKERERIFNDAVKQLRALTALEVSPCTTTREEEMDVKSVLTLSDEVDNCRSGSSKRNSSSLDEQPRQSTPPSATQVVSSDNEEKCKTEVDEPGNHEKEIIDVEMDDDDEEEVTIVPPITSIRKTTTTPNPVEKPEDIQLTDETRNFKEEEQEKQSDLEMQRQRQRQALRGPTPSSSPQTRWRKTPPVVSKTGVKRDREEYEEGQVDEEDDDHDVGIDKPSNIHQEKPNGSPIRGSISTETQVTLADADNSEEIVILERELKLKDDMPRRQKDKKISTNGRQVTSQTEIIKAPTVKVPNPKAPGKRSHYREFIGPPIPLTSLRSFVTAHQHSTTPLLLPSPQPRLPKKLGINHMDLLYKTEQEVMICRFCLSLEQNPDATTAERRKSKANTKKFPLNASWADLINHCQTEHTKACEDMEKLSPSQLAEMKQRTR